MAINRHTRSRMSWTLVVISLLLFTSCDHRSLEELTQTAEAYEAKGDYQMANIIYDEMMKAYPNYGGAYINKGVNLAWNDQPYEAIKVYKKGLKHVPESLLLHYNLASKYHEIKQVDSAIIYFTSALALSEKCQPVSNEPQFVFVVSNEENYIQASDIHFGRGVCYFDQDKFKECAADMKECVKCGYSLASSHYMLGVCLYTLGEEKRGCQEMQKALEYGDPDAQKYLDVNCLEHIASDSLESEELPTDYRLAPMGKRFPEAYFHEKNQW